MSFTPDLSRKIGMGMAPSPAPFFTPRPEWRRPDSRVFDFSANKDKEVNVQVVLRCRPLSEEDQRLNVQKAISCNEHRREVTVLQSAAHKQLDRVFAFDKVFGPKTQQRSIYDQAIAPIVSDVLDGFNCTVFTYGQTGTGKTYTMEGGMRNKGGDLPAEAGVIPRAVRQIFDTLESQNADYSVKVTFLELYNEEITDLLAPSDDNLRPTEDRQQLKKPVSLMEDGKGSVVVRGLEEEAVYSVNEIYTLLERGAAKRRTADTLLNKRSSRSHSIFSITVHIKESAVGDEELIKCGKINLVDLAGSENISRSGARESLAREAGEINKSLLTLGRVINALVEHSSHVPYRDSKLTRLLRDSLGGKTKTCIIATISPSAYCLEETLSTLDYAFRAKYIKNRPEANHKMSKSVLLKDLYLELEKMKEDVRAAREKNGIYVPQERFVRDEAEKKARNEKIELLENDLILTEKEVDRFRELYLTEQEQKLDIQCDFNQCKASLEASNKALLDLQENYRVATSIIKEKEFVISNLLSSENALMECAKGLRSDLQYASEDITSLFGRLDQKDRIETANQNLVLTFGSQLDQSLKDLHKTILGSVSQQAQQLSSMEETFRTNLAVKHDASRALESRVNKMSETYCSGVASLKNLASLLHRKASSDLEKISSTISSQVTVVETFLASMVRDAEEVMSDMKNSLDEQNRLLEFSTNKQEEGIKRSLVAAKMISSATMNFFNELHNRACQVDSILEVNQRERSRQLINMEAILKEEAQREEREALENIAAILANVKTKRIAMVSEASRNIMDSNKQENERLLKEMLNMRQVTVGARNEMGAFLDKSKNNYMEDSFSLAEHTALMLNCLNECYERVDCSRKQWGNAESSLNNLNSKSVVEIQCAVEENICANRVTHEEFVSTCLNIDAEFNERVSDTLGAIKDSLHHDKENKKELDSMTSMSLDQLNSIQEKHGKSVFDIRSNAEMCLTKDYTVDQRGHETPKKRNVRVPSLASIEELKSRPGCEQFMEKNKAFCSPHRAPFMDVN